MVERMMSVLWEMTLTAAWAAGVVFLARLALKKRAPRRVICLLWLVVFVRLLVPVSLESPLSLVPPVRSEAVPGGTGVLTGPSAPAAFQGGGALPSAGLFQPGSPEARPASPAQEVRPAGTGTAPVVTAPALPGSGPAPEAAAASGFPWADLLAGLWLTGAAVMLAGGLITYLRLRRRVRFAVRISGRVWEDGNVTSPFILGMLRPKIYLPAGLEGRARGLILCHEFAHLRRFDHIVKPLCWLALAIHWFNPAVWAAFFLLSRDMEGACDEAVLRSLGEDVKADYSYTLLSLASGGHIPAPCPIAFDEGDAKGRIKNVLAYRRPALWIVAVSVAAVILAAVCLLTDPMTAKGPEDSPGSSPSPTQTDGLSRDPEPSQSAGPSQSAEPSQAPEEGLNDLLDPWMLEVLKGERTFHNGGEKEYTIRQLRDMVYGEGELPRLTLEVGRLAILDLDRDGASELVVWPVDTLGERDDPTEIGYTTGYFLFHYWNEDTVQVYYPGWRSISDLKADGTFHWSSSAFEGGTGRASFENRDFSIERLSWYEPADPPGTQLYFVEGMYGQSVEQEVFDAAITAQDAKREPDWYTFKNSVLAPANDAPDTPPEGDSPRGVPIPLDEGIENLSVPDFLDAEQQLIYRQAYTMYTHIFGANTMDVDVWPQVGEYGPAYLVFDEPYTPATGLYANWNDFQAAVLSVFTQEFWDARNDWGDGLPIYKNIDGRLCYIAASRGNRGYNPNFPDTFHLMQQTESEISFVLVGHYSDPWPREGESDEEWDERLAANWETYIGYPIKMVMTENGWRFSEFYVAATDCYRSPGQDAPNPELTDDPTPECGGCSHGLEHVFIDHLIDGRLVFRCMEDWFPYYPPYPCAYNSSGVWEGDCDGDGQKEVVAALNGYGTLMLCDAVEVGPPKMWEMKTGAFDPRPLVSAYPNADLSAAWMEPGDELVLCVPLRDSAGEPVSTYRMKLHWDGEGLSCVSRSIRSLLDVDLDRGGADQAGG